MAVDFASKFLIVWIFRYFSSMYMYIFICRYILIGYFIIMCWEKKDLVGKSLRCFWNWWKTKKEVWMTWRIWIGFLLLYAMLHGVILFELRFSRVKEIKNTSEVLHYNEIHSRWLPVHLFCLLQPRCCHQNKKTNNCLHNFLLL